MSATPRIPGGWVLRVLLTTGIASLGLSGGVHAFIAVVTFALLLTPAPKASGAVWLAAHGTVLLATGLLAGFGPPVLGFAVLVSWLLVHRSWTGRSADDIRVALLLATLLLLLGAVGTESVLLAPVFALYAALLPVALLRAELRDSGAAAPRALEVVVGVASASLGLVLFLVLPRLDGGYLGQGSRGGRFPSDVTLGAGGFTSDDSAEVLRLRVTDPGGLPVPGPFHLRGRSLDRFDGARWSVGTPVERPSADAAWDMRAEVWLEPMGGEVLFAPPEVVGFDGTEVQLEPGSAYVPLVLGRGRHYVAYSRSVPLEAVDQTDIGPWVQLPSNLDPRIRPLAYSVAGEEADPAVVARALSDWLARSYTYDVAPPAPSGDAIAWFLFDSRAGHCEYFASALVVMLRTRGIPARLATGFHAGELAEDGTIVARRGNAHAWVEVRTERGWATLDPTPDGGLPVISGEGLSARLDAMVAAWYRDVVEYDMDAQFAAFGAVGRGVFFGGAQGQSPMRAGLVGMIAVVVGMFVVLGVARAVLGRLGAPVRRRPRPDALARLCADARRAVRARGWALPPELPPLDAARWLRTRVGDAAAPLERLAHLTYAARYGGAPPAVDEARGCVRALRGLPRPGEAGPDAIRG